MKGEKKRTDAKEKEDPAHLLETLNYLSFRKKQMHWNASPLLHRAHLNPTLTALLPALPCFLRLLHNFRAKHFLPRRK
jgi:hypothetical protein